MARNESFVPEEYIARRTARRTATVCVVLFAVMLVGLLGTWFVRRGQHQAAMAKLAEVNQQTREAARQLEQLDKLRTRKAQMMRKAAVTSVLVERFKRSMVLAELINHMPSKLSLLEMKLNTRVLRPTDSPATSLQRRQKALEEKEEAEQAMPALDPPETEVSIRLVGVAPTDLQISNFIGALNSHNLFKDVNLKYSEQVEIDKRSMRKFRVDLKMNQDLNARQFKPTKVARNLKQNPMSEKVRIRAPAARP